MSDYIKREDVYRRLTEYYRHTRENQHKSLRIALIGIPSADVAPVRHGHWVVIDAEEPRRYGCSECKRLSWNMENYCPCCGSKMDEEANV